jgi:hypothetical protein
MKRPIRRAVVQSQSLISRLTGFSAFGFGASFKAPEPERQVVRDVLTELEDKRALFSGAVWEEPAHVVSSILRIREILTSGLKRVGDKSPALDAFRIMRASCREFLTLRSTKSFEGKRGMMRNHGIDGDIWEQEEFFIGLGKLRQAFGQQIATLGYLYRIDIEAELASILPPDVKADAGEVDE